MSDPMTQRPVDPPPPPPPVETQRRSASPLIWILVLIALIAFAWYFYNRNAADTVGAPDMSASPPAASDAMTPDTNASPERAARKPSSPKPTVAKASPPRSTEVALLDKPKPSYPPEAFRAGEEGTVTVMANVDASGEVSDASVVDRSGSRALDRAALTEVKRWKFKPATKDGKAVASSIKVPVDYKLSDSKQ